MNHFTVCLGFRNWHSDHLERCLASLAPFPLDVVVVDLGSDAPSALWCVEQATLRDPVSARGGAAARFQYVSHSHREWSRSVALNFATRYASSFTTHFVFTDADMIFPIEWWGQANAYANKRTLCLTDSRDLTEHVKPEPPYREESLRMISLPHARVGEGAAMIVPRRWFREVRGFDEYFQVWGCEDNDLTHRARIAGLDVTWLPYTFVAHQWHRRDWPTQEQFQQVWRNRAHFANTRHLADPVRNRDGWHGDLGRKEVMCMSDTQSEQPQGEQKPEGQEQPQGEQNGEQAQPQGEQQEQQAP